MLSGKDVTGASHVRGELVDVVDILNDAGDNAVVTQVADDELNGVMRTLPLKWQTA